MRKQVLRALLFAVAIAAAGNAAAQSSDQVATEEQDIADARALLQAGRDQMIEEEMLLTASERDNFLPVYQLYRTDVISLRDRYAALVGGYLEAYDAGEIDEAYAKDLLDEWLGYKSDLLQVQQRYVSKFRKVLPMQKVVRFYQLENKIGAEIEVELSRVVPLMESF
jgi:hypothetical protein